KLDRVAGDGGQIRRELSSHGDILTDEIRTDQVQDVLYNFVDTERIVLHPALFQPQAQPTDHFCGTLVFAYDVFKNFAHLGEVGIAVCEDPLGSLRVAEYGAEREVKLVRKRARELA